MKKIPLFLFLGIALTVSFSLPQSSGTGLDIELQEIFELGKEDILFSGIDSMCEDAPQNIYVLDRVASKIYKFSPDGKLLLSFGSKGQGPGEFQAPHDVFVAPDGQVVVSEDMAFVSFFDSEGQFVRRLSAEKGLALTYLSDNFFYAWVWDEAGRTQILVDLEGTVIKTFFSESRDDFSVSAPDETGRRVMFNYATFETAPSFHFNRYRDRFVIAYNGRYEFSLYDSQGKIVTTVKRHVKPQNLSAKERDYLVLQLQETRNWPPRIFELVRKNMAKTKTYFSSILLSEKRIFVFRVRGDLTDSSSGYPVDVFSVDGEFLGSALLPFQPLYISNAFMYVKVFDEEDNLLFQKFQYRIVE